MSWRIDNHPQGGMMIAHEVEPRFTARWTTGAFPIEDVREGALFWTDEGSGEEDAIHLYEIVWGGPVPKVGFDQLMKKAVAAIEARIINCT